MKTETKPKTNTKMPVLRLDITKNGTWSIAGEENADRPNIVRAVNCHEALIRVMNEAKHYASTGKGKEFLLEAIAKAEVY